MNFNFNIFKFQTAILHPECYLNLIQFKFWNLIELKGILNSENAMLKNDIQC